jgi:predicted extracellular nuclease
MKKIYSLFIAAMAITAASAQCTDLFFSEYVEGSGNNKALEIYNPTATAVNLSTYKILQYNNGSGTPTSTLGLKGTLAAGDVYVLCNNSSATFIKNVADSSTTSSVMTFNGNDVLALVNGADTLDRLGVVGVSTNIKFDTTNAVNFTFVRKPNVQQGTKDWAVGTLQWIQFPQDTIRLGAHNMDACGAITDTIARFSPSALTVSESAGTAVVNVVLNAASTSSTFTVDVVYEGGTGTIDDISNYTTQTLTFAPNSSSQAFSVNINDDTNNEAAETFIFKLRNATGGILIGADSTYTLTISASDAPISIVTISQLTSLDSVSSPDSLGKKVQVTGTVYGINNRATGLQFTIHDGTDGIQVFSPASNFGYTVLEGDSVTVKGEVGFFSGVTQLVFIDTVSKIGIGTVPTPVLVQDLDESTESELIRLNNVSLVTPSQWDTTGKASGFSCTVTDGQNTWEIRIDEQTNIFKTNMPRPTGNFNVSGIGGQFDNSSPYTSGYQIQPRNIQDIELISSVIEIETANVQVFPNPNNGQFTINWLENSTYFTATLFNLNGQVITSLQSDVNSIVVSANGIATGLYILEVKGGDKTFRTKLTINK